MLPVSAPAGYLDAAFNNVRITTCGGISLVLCFSLQLAFDDYF